MKTIKEFQGEFRFLSNFHPSPISVRNIGTHQSFIAPTAEHVFQAMKTKNTNEQQVILDAATPGQAKRIGRKVTLRDDWDEIKLDVMRMVVEAKFTQNPHLLELLLATGDAELIEGNWHHDSWWGIDLKTGKGHNHLGIILMNIRKEFRS